MSAMLIMIRKVLMNGTAQIISGFLSFGSLHIHTSGFEPWQWYVSYPRLASAAYSKNMNRLMIITGALTLITSACFFFFFPDSPTNAWFLNSDERAKAVLRIKENQTGVENKHFKKEQYVR